MSVGSRVRDWLRSLKPRSGGTNDMGPLREFVYLDDVSVYSILASRRGGIAAEFTERQTATLNSEIAGSASVGLGGTSTKLDSRLRSSQVEGSQVLRKAIIQTSFKELYDIERESLTLGPVGKSEGEPPTVRGIADLKRRLDGARTNDTWLVDSGGIRRGDVVEVTVELEADTIFRMISIISTFSELIEDNEKLFGSVNIAQLAEMSSVARLLEGLLVGLVPIRGRLVDYRAATVDERDVLVHRTLLEQIPIDEQPETYPVFVVGVTERHLFWKDIRRVLFSRARCTVFGRFGKEGLADDWHPVKVADLLSGLVPGFDESIGEFTATAERAMNAAVDSRAEREGEDGEEKGTRAVEAYARMLVRHHDGDDNPELIKRMIQGVSTGEEWLSTVDGRRAVFGKVTRRIEGTLGVETSGDVAYTLRVAAVNEADRARASAGVAARARRSADRRGGGERFLDTEIVAVYW